MRKKFLFIVLLIGCSIKTFAQPEKGDVELGVDVGYNFSLIINSRGISGTTDGVNFAGAVDYYFSDR